MKISTIIKWTLIIVIALIPFISHAQINADSIYHNRLFYLCKAWGHVKYHHTEVANGSINWDNELLIAIGNSGNATSNTEYDDVIKTMVNNAGQMEMSTDTLPFVADSLNNNADISWFYNPIFSDTTSALLDTIMQRFRPQYNVYVYGSSVSNLFWNDKMYWDESNFPSEVEKRLLALFRYWNIIHYFFPYKNVMDQHWDTTLIEFIPRIIEANDELSYHLTFKELTTRINDSHAFFYSYVFEDWDGIHFPPFLVRFIENETVVTKVREGVTNIKVGDIIKKIDGQDIYELRDSLRKYAAGSNDVFIDKNLNDLVLWGDIGWFEMTIDDGTGLYTDNYFRNNSNYSNLSSNNNPIWKIDTNASGCQIGVVDMGLLEVEHLFDMFDELWETDAIIFDVRNYPNNTLWDILDYLYPDSIHFVNFAIPDIFYPGTRYWASPILGNGTAYPYQGKIMILFDERTISHAEYTCMSLEQFPEAVKIGSTTAGADGNVTRIFLPGFIVTNFTFFGVFYPDYSPTQRVGIVPDFEVHPTILGIRNGVDEVMEFALNFMDCGVLDIEEADSKKDIILYPNPVNHLLQYEILADNLSNNILFEIMDVRGRILKTIAKNTVTGEIDLSELNNGIYFVKIITDHGILIETITKM